MRSLLNCAGGGCSSRAVMAPLQLSTVTVSSSSKKSSNGRSKRASTRCVSAKSPAAARSIATCATQ